MYQLLPLVCAYSSIIPTLPVELWCLILRMLDPTSLVAAVRSSGYLQSVVQGDFTLRKKFQDGIQEEQKKIFQTLTQPGMAVRISRKDQARLFSTNSQKTVHVKRQELSTLIQKNMKSKKSAIGSIKGKTKHSRFTPYRL